MKKKILALVLVLALAATGVVGASMAYLTDEAGEMSNVFAIGDVDIKLTEEVSVDGAGKVVEGPSDDNGDDTGATYTGVMPGDWLQKEVVVKNTGKNAAYVAVTVTMNNAGVINTAIDDHYEGLGYTDDQIQAIYDEVFDGWDMRYDKYDDENKHLGMRLTIDREAGKQLLHIDSAKTTDWDWDTYMYAYGNIFQSAQEEENSNAAVPAYGIHPASEGYYTAGLAQYDENDEYIAGSGDYTFVYTYYLYLESEEEYKLFDGLNVPEDFDNEQIKMFEGLKIDVSAKAIQADNVIEDPATANTDPEVWPAAFRMLAGGEADTWDGTSDISWYNDTDTAFTITTAEQLAGFAKLVDEGKTFEGKTVKLGKNIDLYAENENGEPVSFNPIGSYRKETAFKGTFDGQGLTISNLSQNTWALDNGYYYGDLGLGLFGLVEDATIKDLTMDGASISGESAICGTVAACAYGDCTFENITVKNSKVNDYQYYAGGVVGWASGNHTYKNINMDASTIVGSQWGDFGNANGGIIGGISSSAKILFEDCTVACRIDATNDVVSAYQWYNYRNSGMLIGRVPQTITNGEVKTVATPTYVTCKNVTVIYGDWANYTYCEFAGTGYPYVRVQAGVSVDAYSNVRYGHPTDANGNTVVDDNHVHNDGEAHQELIAFDQLFGGPANHRYCYYGIDAFDGVTVVYNNK